MALKIKKLSSSRKLIRAYKRGTQVSIAKKLIPKHLRAGLFSLLSYSLMEQLRGKDASVAKEMGRSTINVTKIRLYEVDEHKNICFCTGWVDDVSALLRDHGYRLKIVSLDEPKRSIRTDMARLKKHFPEFRHRQEEALHLVEKHDCGIINCFTAWGKSTMLAMWALYLSNAKIDIICKMSRVIRQIRNDLLEYLPDVGLIGAGSNSRARRVNCYCDYLSVRKSDFDADIVFVDEVHTCANPNMLEELSKYKNAKFFGLTASLERWDNRHYELFNFFGPVRMKIDYEECLKAGSVTDTEVHWFASTKCNDPDKLAGMSSGPWRDREALWKNKPRNDLIAEIAKAYRKQYGQTLVYCDKIEHLVELKKRLPTWSVAYNPEQAKVRKGEKNFIPKALERGIFREEDIHTVGSLDALQTKFRQGKVKKCLANSVWKAGVDFPKLRVLVRGDGIGGFIQNTQVPGRVVRKYEDKFVAIVADLDDSFSSLEEKRTNRRKTDYRKHNFKEVRARCQNGKILLGKTSRGLSKGVVHEERKIREKRSKKSSGSKKLRIAKRVKLKVKRIRLPVTK